MLKKITLLVLLLTAVLALSACQPYLCGGPQSPTSYSSVERFLADMALIKFDEARAVGHTPFRELYMPRRVPEGFSLSQMWFFELHDDLPIVFEYADIDYNRARFIWNRGMSTRAFVGTPWEQHGYEFQINFPENLFTDQELYDFSYAQPVVAWELQGNAVSVSIQDLENVRIFYEGRYEIGIEPTYIPVGIRHNYLIGRHLLEHHTLYRIDGENRSVIGYRWSLDAELDRWQYVLEPDTYTFHVEGVIRGEVGLLVRHFDDHEIVLSVDYGAELAGQDFTSFTITVTPTDSYLTINE